MAGRLARLACERHLRDLVEGPKRGLRWQPDLAARHFAFVECLELALPGGGTRPFTLSPHQKFVNGSIFGWLGAPERDPDSGQVLTHAGPGQVPPDPEGQTLTPAAQPLGEPVRYRRFRTAYIEEAKGNGKTPLAAATGLYCVIADGEEEAEGYSAAVGRDQAKICFNDAARFVSRSRALRRRINANANNLAFLATHSFFRPVSSEGRGLDGKRVHVAVIDELHEHPDAMVVDKMSAGTKGRRQSLIYEITNSGWDRTSVCYAHHEYTVKVLEGLFDGDENGWAADSWFGFIAAVDEDDDPLEDESCWPKANPNLDVSVTRDYLRRQVREAKGIPAKANLVLRLNFCRWTEAAKVWIPDADWRACALGFDPREEIAARRAAATTARTMAQQVPVPNGNAEPSERARADSHAGPAAAVGPISAFIARLKGRECFAGLDLASVADITALVLDFPIAPGDSLAPGGSALRALGGHIWLPFFWIPQDTVRKRAERDRVPYDVWVEQGYLLTTPGNVTDYGFIRKFIHDSLAPLYRVREIALDRLFQGAQMSTDLQNDGHAVVAFGQGFLSMAAPCKALEELALARRILTLGNPVLRWMMANVAIKEDPAGNRKPDKQKSRDKIDGIVAGLMALGRASAAKPEGSIDGWLNSPVIVSAPSAPGPAKVPAKAATPQAPACPAPPVPFAQGGPLIPGMGPQ